MNARWELGAALAAAALLVVLATWSARENGSPADVEPDAPPAADRTANRPLLQESSGRSAASAPDARTQDPSAALVRARDEAIADDGRDEPTRALETRPVESPERHVRADAVTELATRLGFLPGSSDAADLASWMTDSARADREAVAGGPAPADPARIAAFNTAAEARSRALVDRFGVASAEEIARRFPIHRLDPSSGALVRVDPHGGRLRLTGQD